MRPSPYDRGAMGQPSTSTPRRDGPGGVPFRSAVRPPPVPVTMARVQRCASLVEHHVGRAGRSARRRRTGRPLRRLRPPATEESPHLHRPAGRFGVQPNGWEKAAGPFADALPARIPPSTARGVRHRAPPGSRSRRARAEAACSSRSQVPCRPHLRVSPPLGIASPRVGYSKRTGAPRPATGGRRAEEPGTAMISTARPRVGLSRRCRSESVRRLASSRCGSPLSSLGDRRRSRGVARSLRPGGMARFRQIS